jgi:predicted nucleic acid-binding protein
MSGLLKDFPVNSILSPSETSDPDDNMFLECAQAAKADYLITGNTGHFPERWKYTELIVGL